MRNVIPLLFDVFVYFSQTLGQWMKASRTTSLMIIYATAFCTCRTSFRGFWVNFCLESVLLEATHLPIDPPCVSVRIISAESGNGNITNSTATSRSFLMLKHFCGGHFLRDHLPERTERSLLRLTHSVSQAEPSPIDWQMNLTETALKWLIILDRRFFF